VFIADILSNVIISHQKQTVNTNVETTIIRLLLISV
jgi:hypothetical protein